MLLMLELFDSSSNYNNFIPKNINILLRDFFGD